MCVCVCELGTRVMVFSFLFQKRKEERKRARDALGERKLFEKVKTVREAVRNILLEIKDCDKQLLNSNPKLSQDKWDELTNKKNDGVKLWMQAYDELAAAKREHEIFREEHDWVGAAGALSEEKEEASEEESAKDRAEGKGGPRKRAGLKITSMKGGGPSRPVDDEEVEEAPAKGKKRARRSVDEEEETPAKGKKRARQSVDEGSPSGGAGKAFESPASASEKGSASSRKRKSAAGADGSADGGASKDLLAGKRMCWAPVPMDAAGCVVDVNDESAYGAMQVDEINRPITDAERQRGEILHARVRVGEHVHVKVKVAGSRRAIFLPAIVASSNQAHNAFLVRFLGPTLSGESFNQWYMARHVFQDWGWGFNLEVCWET